MPTFYSPNGNPEVWENKPNNYYTEEEWLNLNPPEEIEINTESNDEPTIAKRIDNIEDILLGILKGDINV